MIQDFFENLPFNCFKRQEYVNWGNIMPEDFYTKPGKYGTYKRSCFGKTVYYKYGHYWKAVWKGNKLYFEYHEY